jgi:hypothetical protein
MPQDCACKELFHLDAFEHFLSVPRIEGIVVPRYWGTYTYCSEFYVIVLGATSPKPKSFRD